MPRLVYYILPLIMLAILVAIPSNATGGNCYTPRRYYSYPTYHRPYQPPCPPPCPPTEIIEKPIFLEKNTIIEQPIIIQERPVPAFVFQVLSAYGQTQPAVIGPPGTQQATAVAPVTTQPQPQPAVQTHSPAPTTNSLSSFLGQRDEDLPVLAIGPDTGSPRVERREALDPNTINALYNSCARCHGTESPKGKVVLFDSNNHWNPYRTDGQPLSRKRIWEVTTGTSDIIMPPGADTNPALRLPPNVIEALRQSAGES